MLLMMTILAARAEGYTLKECVDIAYENNLELKAKTEDLKKYEKKVSEAISNVFPSISIQTGIGYIIEPEYTSIAMEDTTIPPGLMPPGIKPANSYLVKNPDYGFQHSLSIQQIIFSSQAFLGISLAKTQREVEALNYEILGRKIRSDVEKAFYNILIMEKVAEIREKSWSQDSIRLKMVKKKFEEGLVSEFEHLRSQVEYKNSKAELNNSKLMFRMAKLYMFFLLDKEYEDNAKFVGEFRMPKELPDYQEAFTAAKERRLEYRMMDRTLEVFKKLIRLHQSAYLPAIVAQGKFDMFSASDTLENYFSFDDFSKDYSVMLGLQWELFSGFKKKSKVDQARLDYKKMKISKRQMDAGIEMEIRQALWQLEQYEMDYESALSSLEEAEKLIEIANVQYEEGLITFVELNDAQLAYDATQLNYNRSLFNYSTALSDYYRAIGK